MGVLNNVSVSVKRDNFMAGDNRGCSPLIRRAEQLKRWDQSETNKECVYNKCKKRTVRFNEECTFLNVAAEDDRDELVTMLDNGADINTVNQDGITALHAACIDNNMEVVEFLVDHGADINRCDMEGWTPLHATASCGSITMAKFLIDRGADLSVVNNDGELAIDVVEEDEMERLLKDEMDIRGIDYDASRSKEERLMLEDAQLWLGQGQITEKPHIKTGATALHVAAGKGYIKVMRLLIQAGADINAKDFDGWTPLHAAVHWGQTEAVEILCDSMANMDLVNLVGQTPHDLADISMRPLLDNFKQKQDSIKLISQNKVPTYRKRSSTDRTRRREREAFGSDGTSSDESTESVDVKEELKSSAPIANNIDIISQKAKEKQYVEEIPTTCEVPISVCTTTFAPTSTLSSISPSRPPSITANGLPPPKKSKSMSSIQTEIEKAGVLDSTEATSLAAKLTATSVIKNFFKSFVPPSRDDESETQRKAHAKLVRSTRRSTQGITLEDVRAAEQHINKTKSPELNSHTSDAASTFSLEDVRDNEKSKLEREVSVESVSRRKSVDEKKDKPEDKCTTTREGTQAVIHRKKKAKRRSTGVVNVDMDEITDKASQNNEEEEEDSSVSEKDTSSKNSTSSRKLSTENGDIDYKKLYDEQLVENDRLMNRLRSYEKELRQARESLAQHNKQASTRNAAAEAERREKRALERKLSEMEEELRGVEQLRQERQRLRDENGALIRVISKLSR